MATRSYDDLSKDELVRLLQARDRRDATRFGLVWEANEIERDAKLNADFVALDLDPELSVGKEGPWKNLIIEGDNFDALRYLRMSFAGRVKCIYIDPPYNTGNRDFVYNDRFVNENDGWRYSKWIDFLYQRLIIARDLLRDDGVLLCSINDENRAPLEMLLNKIMPGRRLGSFVWRTKDSANDAGGNLSQVHEHVLVYSNRQFAFRGKALKIDDYRNPDADDRGDWTAQPITCGKSLNERANLYYPIQDSNTGYWYPCDPDAVWRYATETRLKTGQQLRADTIEALIRQKEIWFPECKPTSVLKFETRNDLIQAIRAGNGPVLPKKKTPLLRESLPDLDFWVGKPIAPGRPSRKDFLKNKQKMVGPISSWIAGENEKIDYLYSEDDEQTALLRSARGGEGSSALVAILGSKVFNHPKPPSLLGGLIQQTTDSGDIILDFFAGSGTTAHAVLKLNAEDGGRRRFILVSNSEATEEEPDKNLCREVCARRVGNVIRGYGDTPGTGGDFAYLRTRRIAPGRLVEIDHAQVWTALQLIHRETLGLYEPQAGLLVAGDEEQTLIYVPRLAKELLPALRKAVAASRAVMLYSWQAEVLRQQVRASHVQHEAIPEALARRFGLRGVA